MVYKGHIRNGVIVLDEPAVLPEGAEVAVAVRSQSDGADAAPMSLLERMSDLIDASNDLPPDASQHKRHYLYGHPKS